MLFIFTLLYSLQLNASTTFSGDHLRGRLVAPQSAIGADGQMKLAVYFRLDPKWHIYWKNPGDSGSAPKLQVTGGKLTAVKWPYPKRIAVGDLINFGYEHEVALLLNLNADADAQEIKINLEWLVCKEECIPGFGAVTLPIRRAARELWKENTDPDVILYNQYEERVPQFTESVSIKTIERTPMHLKVELTADDQWKELEVFPADTEIFRTAAPIVNPVAPGRLEVSLPLSSNAENKPGSTELTFVVKEDKEIRSFMLNADLQPQTLGFVLALLFAFLGGLILNLMPCVFPVLSLKFFSFLKEKDASKIHKSAWAYTLVVLTTFTLVGAALTVLRLSGEAVGWGYQLQSPAMIYFLALLFFVMALSFWGFFEFGSSIAYFAGRLGASRLLSGSFGTGVLAVIVASPCTAPFMGSALGLTLLLPWPQSLAIFFSLGIGMAFPMLLIGYIPGLATYLPRSGLWMENFKKAMAFPLLATSLWLLWVLSHQRGSDIAFFAMTTALAMTFAAWVWTISQKIIFKYISLILIIGLPIYALFKIHNSQAPSMYSERVQNWNSYSRATVEQKIREQPVFIDFTASWCITCQVNKRAVLDTDEIQIFFKNNNVYLMRADWTNQDPEITKALAALGRNSVPVYAFYAKSGKAQLLPQLLTKKMIFDLFKPTGESK